MGTVIHLQPGQLERPPRQVTNHGDAQVMLFTGVRYDRPAPEPDDSGPNGAQRERKRL